MLLFENISLALNALKSNKSRSALTMLGIIIGIASVIAIMTIGNSMEKGMESSMSSNGADVIRITVMEKSDDFWGFDGMGFASSVKPMSDKDYITEKTMTKLLEHFEGRIKGIALSEAVGEGQAVNKNLYANVTINGENEYQLEADVPELIAGRYFYDTDYAAKRKIALVSDCFVNNMFGGDCEKALGQTISVVINNRYYTYTIVGVYKYEEESWSMGTTSERDKRTELYLPLQTAQAQTHNDDNKYQTIGVLAASVTDATDLTDEIEEYLNDAFYKNNDDYEISTMSMQSLLDSLAETMQMLTMAISLIAGIALLVGGIGVMNIMMVSITERTREIGTRKALGATNSSIRVQFIVESIVLCLVGGVIGIILGLLIGAGASKLMKYPAAPSIMSIIVSVGFSAFIGVFFGYYPANKAAKMNPIDALRYE